MEPVSRRAMIAAAAAGSAMAAGQALAAGSPQAAPQPIRGSRGGTDPGPANPAIDAENPDAFASLATDVGDIPNLKWPFALSHNRLLDGGWARQTTVRELPVSTAMAGVDMRLNPGAVRELHWHKADEWSLMLSGDARITCIDEDGRNFIADVNQGDLWYFPSGLPHSIQALDQGCEFLLVFNDGAFDENNTFLISQWLAHVPREVLAKNFSAQQSDFDALPKEELYIFPQPVPPSLQVETVRDKNGTVPNPFVFRMMDLPPIQCPGGTVRIVDSATFKASQSIAAAYVEIEPGGMRELHWHPAADEWQYYISGIARMTVFGAGRNSRTFDYQAGDVGYVPRSMGHYIENTGTTPVRYLEMFATSHYSDVSLKQWLALVPPQLVQAHLHLGGDVMAKLSQDKQFVVVGGAQPG